MNRREECIYSILLTIDEQILNFKNHNLPSEKLLGLVKAKYLIKEFGKINYNGTLKIQAGYLVEEKCSETYVLEINADEIILTCEGFVVQDPQCGADSFCSEFLYMTQDQIEIDNMNNLISFHEGFNTFSVSNENITIKDDINGLPSFNPFIK